VAIDVDEPTADVTGRSQSARGIGHRGARSQATGAESFGRTGRTASRTAGH
jgi:hypothetical protein